MKITLKMLLIAVSLVSANVHAESILGPVAKVATAVFGGSKVQADVNIAVATDSAKVTNTAASTGSGSMAAAGLNANVQKGSPNTAVGLNMNVAVVTGQTVVQNTAVAVGGGMAASGLNANVRDNH